MSALYETEHIEMNLRVSHSKSFSVVNFALMSDLLDLVIACHACTACSTSQNIAPKVTCCHR